ncbi:hypothetical protein RSOLAG1IB_09439 [Rhizoctonia solani AG-1 IB]|uniref:Uncharacterized protein n=1 Tax=Thanatephorus cucumeris (strain AG1-IB / isolate 7/3/14) TaxID=1108050 RepID=A0A0B7FQF3_THACB|nr:hypothetical protein RSOLAG1IB_09439 [Rhizoctonia solani AG-1 IB]
MLSVIQTPQGPPRPRRAPPRDCDFFFFGYNLLLGHERVVEHRGPLGNRKKTKTGEQGEGQEEEHAKEYRKGDPRDCDQDFCQLGHCYDPQKSR